MTTTKNTSTESDTKPCPVCGEGQAREITYVGVVEDLPMKYSECDTCMSEFATAEQINYNAQQIRKMKQRGRERNEEKS